MSAVKFIKGSKDIIEGLAIPFGSADHKDFDGEFFTKDTDLSLDWFDTRPMLYHHGLNPSVKTVKVGAIKTFEVKDDGLWVQGEIEKNNRYRQVVTELIEAGALGFSSGTMSHLIERDNKTGEIKVWPWIEESLTPTPANPDALQVYMIKATEMLEHLSDAGLAVPAELVAAALKTLESPERLTLPDEGSFADRMDRMVVDGSALVKARKDWRSKSGRGLSAEVRDRLAAHPKSLRELAKDIEGLVGPDDDGKALSAYARFLELDSQLPTT